MSSRDPERGCGCLVLVFAASLLVLLVLAWIDVRLLMLWLIAGSIGLVVVDSLLGE